MGKKWSEMDDFERLWINYPSYVEEAVNEGDSKTRIIKDLTERSKYKKSAITKFVNEELKRIEEAKTKHWIDMKHTEFIKMVDNRLLTDIMDTDLDYVNLTVEFRNKGLFIHDVHTGSDISYEDLKSYGLTLKQVEDGVTGLERAVCRKNGGVWDNKNKKCNR